MIQDLHTLCLFLGIESTKQPCKLDISQEIFRESSPRDMIIWL